MNKDPLKTAGAVVLLMALCWAAFGGALQCGFVYFDDDQYVFENAAIAGGWSWSAVRWAFTTGHAANWHPLTWLSHMTDIELFGMDPRAHHAVNVWIHALNAVLLFGVLRAFSCPTAGFVLVASFVTAVGLGQMFLFNGKQPRKVTIFATYLLSNTPTARSTNPFLTIRNFID